MALNRRERRERYGGKREDIGRTGAVTQHHPEELFMMELLNVCIGQ
jgi:hypothetical protein